VRRIEEGNGGRSRKGEDKCFENEHREDALAMIDDITNGNVM
jgi:hypothetical protein